MMAAQKVPPNLSRCEPRKKLSLVKAREEAREIQRYFRMKVLFEFCESCDAYHIVADPDYVLVGKINRRILEMVALGYRIVEIATAREVGLTPKAVELRIARMQRVLGANSITHLAMLAAYLGMVTPQKHFPGLKGKHE